MYNRVGAEFWWWFFLTDGGVGQSLSRHTSEAEARALWAIYGLDLRLRAGLINLRKCRVAAARSR